MRPNDWSYLTETQWMVMLGAVILGCALALFIEWVGKPRYNKWNDWRRKRR